MVSPDNQQPLGPPVIIWRSVSFHTPPLKRGIRKSHRLINTGKDGEKIERQAEGGEVCVLVGGTV